MDGGSSTLLVRWLDVDSFSASIGTTYRKIRYFYYINEISDHYRVFKIPKKSGGERLISSPDNQLGLLQSRVAKILAELYKPRDAAKAFIKGRSIVQNAAPHVRKQFVFNIDLLDFFPSITFPRVRGLLMAPPYNVSPEVSSVIAHLCTLNGVLPQGAPTSPILSNMICSKLDRELTLLAKEEGCVYTRYADDITFSFVCSLPHLPEAIVSIDKSSGNVYGADAGEKLRKVIESNGFSINGKKTRLQSNKERQIVTGIKVNKKLNLDRRFIRKTSAILHSLEVNGIKASEDRYNSTSGVKNGLRAHLRGRIQYIGQIKGKESPVYERLAVRFKDVYGSGLPLHVRSRGDVKFSRFANQRCWILEAGMSQATGFMVGENMLVTCNHFFTKNPGDFEDGFVCDVYRVNARSLVKARRVYYDEARDLAFLKIDGADNFEFFSVGVDAREPKQGDAVTVLGFPDFKSGASAVNRFWARITNVFPYSGVGFAEIDHDIAGGNSGGPVLNDKNEVVGVAARGKVADRESGEIVGWNGFVVLSELKVFLSNAKAALG